MADFRTRIVPEGISEKKIKHILASIVCIMHIYSYSLLWKVQAIVHHLCINQIFEKFREFLEHYYNIFHTSCFKSLNKFFICDYLGIS